MCFYNRKKLKQLEQNLDIIVMEHKEEYNKVCMLSSKIIKIKDYINKRKCEFENCSNKEVINQYHFRQLIYDIDNILNGEDNE